MNNFVHTFFSEEDFVQSDSNSNTLVIVTSRYLYDSYMAASSSSSSHEQYVDFVICIIADQPHATVARRAMVVKTQNFHGSDVTVKFRADNSSVVIFSSSFSTETEINLASVLPGFQVPYGYKNFVKSGESIDSTKSYNLDIDAIFNCDFSEITTMQIAVSTIPSNSSSLCDELFHTTLRYLLGSAVLTVHIFAEEEENKTGTLFVDRAMNFWDFYGKCDGTPVVWCIHDFAMIANCGDETRKRVVADCLHLLVPDMIIGSGIDIVVNVSAVTSSRIQVDGSLTVLTGANIEVGGYLDIHGCVAIG